MECEVFDLSVIVLLADQRYSNSLLPLEEDREKEHREDTHRNHRYDKIPLERVHPDIELFDCFVQLLLLRFSFLIIGNFVYDILCFFL